MPTFLTPFYFRSSLTCSTHWYRSTRLPCPWAASHCRVLHQRDHGTLCWQTCCNLWSLLPQNHNTFCFCCQHMQPPRFLTWWTSRWVISLSLSTTKLSQDRFLPTSRLWTVINWLQGCRLEDSVLWSVHSYQPKTLQNRKQYIVKILYVESRLQALSSEFSINSFSKSVCIFKRLRTVSQFGISLPVKIWEINMRNSHYCDCNSMRVESLPIVLWLRQS